jgi:HAD superfamily hydrolase (TIGR01509 family)
MFDAVIFDWDGTLADTRKVIVISFHTVLKEIDCDVSSDYIERRIGIGAADTFRDVLQSRRGWVDETLVSRLVDRKSEVQIQLADEVRLFEGTRALLDLLRGKVKVGLASMNNRSVINHLLKIHNLEQYFEVVLTVECVSKSKPDPEIFIKTAHDLNAIPEKCIVFEDSIFGVKAAKLAGMTCIAVTTGVYTMDELKQENPDLAVKTLLDSRISSFVLQ